MNKPIIDGYAFSSVKDTEDAKKEYENITKLKRKLNVENIDEMIKVYNQLVSRKYFSTPVGLGFLHDMREYLMTRVEGDPLPPVPVPRTSNSIEKREEQISDTKYNKLKTEHDKLLGIKKKLVIAVTALVVLVVGMFFIIVTNDNLGYFNAEEKVLDKYAAWEERLQSWEQELIEREDKLDDLIEKP